LTHRDPPGRKRSAGFNSVVVLLLVLLLAIAGAYVWSQWSADADSALDDSAGAPVQPAELPPPDAGTPSPEGAETPR
jgi:hypothetical protein